MLLAFPVGIVLVIIPVHRSDETPPSITSLLVETSGPLVGYAVCFHLVHGAWDYQGVWMAVFGFVALAPIVVFAARRGRMGGRWPRYSLRYLLVLVSVVAISLGVARSIYQAMEPPFLDPVSSRSFLGGDVCVEVAGIGAKICVKWVANWPNADPDCQIRFAQGLIDSNGTYVSGGGGIERTLRHPTTSGFVVEEMPQGISPPVRAVLDYEIWDGEPERGELLCKDSVVSEPFADPDEPPTLQGQSAKGM